MRRGDRGRRIGSGECYRNHLDSEPGDTFVWGSSVGGYTGSQSYCPALNSRRKSLLNSLE